MIEFASREAASRGVAAMVASALEDGIQTNGSVSFLVSGGSTPKRTFALLSEIELAWDKVDIGLIDERCVPFSHAASNAGLALQSLLQGKASKASFVPMATDEGTEAGTLAEINARYEALIPARCIILGMGNDGHTASWFPGASNLDDAFDARSDPVVHIDASGCKVAGEITNRLTLTRAAIAQARQAILILFGDEKKRVFEAAMTKSVEEAPIRAAIEDLGNKLMTVWAP